MVIQEILSGGFIRCANCERLISGSLLLINCIFQHLDLRLSRKQAGHWFTPVVIGSGGELAAVVDYSSVDLLDGQYINHLKIIQI